MTGLTYGERMLSVSPTLQPVPTSARTELSALRVRLPTPTGSSGAAGGAGEISAASGCLVSRWQKVWVVRTDRSRTFIATPPADCLGRATPIEDSLAAFPQAHGGGAGYALDKAQTAAACAALDGCVLPEGRSAFSSGQLYLMHNGTDAAISLAALPPTVEGTRRGGTDAANAATWRMTGSPVGMTPSAATVKSGEFYLEAFDRPGHVLAPSATASAVVLAAVAPNDAKQRWVRRDAPLRPGDSPDLGGAVNYENAGRGGLYSSLCRPPAGSSRVSLHRGAAISREFVVCTTSNRADAATFDSHAPPLAAYASTSFWAAAPPAASSAGGESTARGKKPRSRQSFLLMPLHEMIDEHYTVYFCKPASADEAMRPPHWCL